MPHPKHARAGGPPPAVPRWLVRARSVVQFVTAIVTLIGAVVALLARLGVPWLR